MKFDLSLYLVTDNDLLCGRRMEEVVEEAVQGGVTLVQLREKNASTKHFYEQAMRLKSILKAYHVPLIINDRLDIALACEAEGIHIGQSDMPYDVVRRLMGKERIIGLSVENRTDALEANKLDVDYIGISPVFGTPTKTDTALPFGLAGVRDVMSVSRHPSVGIGGINHTNAADIIRSGANGIAVVSAIISAENPRTAARDLLSIVEHSKKEL